MTIDLRNLAVKGWPYARVPVWLIFAIITAFFAAYVASELTGKVYERIILGYHWLDQTFGKQSGIAQEAPTHGKLFAGVAIGAAVVVTWFKDTVEKVSHLWPWAGGKFNCNSRSSHRNIYQRSRLVYLRFFR